jgi:hypothetical protein
VPGALDSANPRLNALRLDSLPHARLTQVARKAEAGFPFDRSDGGAAAGINRLLYALP